MEKKEINPMGYKPIAPLVMSISVPLMLSMLVQALYNVVDSIFVAKISETALTAVSLAFPLQNLVIAFGVGTSVGVNSYLARKLGEKDKENAEKTGETGLILALITWAFFAFFGFFFSRSFLSLYTKDPILLNLSTRYSRIVLVFSMGFFINVVIERIMQATGDSFHSMLTQMSGALTNIVLDPIFIFIFKLGVDGAAIATVIGQFVSLILAFSFLKKNKFVTIKFKFVKLDWNIVKGIYQTGLPTIITNGLGTIMVSAMNMILIVVGGAMGPTAVAVFGIYFKLQSFIFMPIFGLNSGLIPIVAFNYGAKNKGRIIKALKFGATIALSIMAFGTLLFMIFPSSLLNLFSASTELKEIGIHALRKISLHFLPAALSIILISSFQATGVGKAGMIVSLLRQLFVLIPASFLLGHFLGLNYIWYSFIIAEIFSLTITVVFFINIYKSKIKPLDNAYQKKLSI